MLRLITGSLLLAVCAVLALRALAGEKSERVRHLYLALCLGL